MCALNGTVQTRFNSPFNSYFKQIVSISYTVLCIVYFFLYSEIPLTRLNNYSFNQANMSVEATNYLVQ